MVDTLEQVAERVNNLENEMPQPGVIFRKFRKANLIAKVISQQADIVREMSPRLNE